MVNMHYTIYSHLLPFVGETKLELLADVNVFGCLWWSYQSGYEIKM